MSHILSAVGGLQDTNYACPLDSDDAERSLMVCNVTNVELNSYILTK